MGSFLVTQPLISINPDSVHLLDILLPPLLIALALIIYDLENNNKNKKNKNKNKNKSHIFTNHTTHSRLLPKTSIHQFKYNLLQFGLDLDLLESGQLDIPYLFKFKNPIQSKSFNYLVPSSWLKLIQIFSISPSSYHVLPHPTRYLLTTTSESHRGNEKKETIPQSIKAPLLDQLKNQFGIHDAHYQIGKVYLLSMPTYLGFTSINPLSIYYCYQKIDSFDKHPSLKYVLLDVQNTFEERHSYLLTVGQNESSKCPSGFHHEWTIPRAFHVSPFNDRSGFYKVSITDPFLNTDETKNSTNQEVKINVKIVLLTSTGEKKFYASLYGIGEPFTTHELIRSWIKLPIILFLTTLRILYQSFILHMGKPRLDVYPKPEPYFDSDHGSKGSNPVQAGAPVGATGWQKSDWRARWSKQIVLDYLNQRVNQFASQSLSSDTQSNPSSDQVSSLGSFENLTDDDQNGPSSSSPLPLPKIINVILIPADKTQEIIKISPNKSIKNSKLLEEEDLVIEYASYNFFIDLILFQSPCLAQIIGDETEASWKVSSNKIFDYVFENPSSIIPYNKTNQVDLMKKKNNFFIERKLIEMINKVRLKYMNWQLSFITAEQVEQIGIKKRTSWFPPPNYLNINPHPYKNTYILDNNSNNNPIDLKLDIGQLVKVLLVLIFSLMLEKAYYFALFHSFVPFRFRFVKIEGPWNRFKRAVFFKNKGVKVKVK